MQNKFKEFWIERVFTDVYNFYFKAYDKKVELPYLVHVIEYAALESANAENIQLKKQIDEKDIMLVEWSKNLWEIESENKKLSEQLESANAEITALKKQIKDGWSKDCEIAHTALELENKKLTEEIARLQHEWNIERTLHKTNVSILEKKDLENARLRTALSNWYNWEQEQIRKEGPYVGAKINELINDAGKALSGEGKEGK